MTFCMVKKGNTLIAPLRTLADKVGSPLWDLGARLYLAHAFFKSGLLRMKDLLNGTFDNQIFLFELEHPVPGLNPEFAAYASTFGEIVLPILVAAGLFARFGAAGLFIMAAIIQFTYIENYQHILWMALAASIFIKGAGFLSLDHFLLKWAQKDA